MKKRILLLLASILFYSCLNSNDKDINFRYEFLPISEAKTPVSFTFGETDTITVKYLLPNSCYSFQEIYYQTKDSTRTVAITAFVALDKVCSLAFIKEEYKFAVMATQTEDYLFKFYKGKNSKGENTYDEVIIPVN